MNNITNLMNQNNSIYNSLVSKNILFIKFNINDNMTEEEIIEILKRENLELKELSKNNRQPVQIKEKKTNVITIQNNNNELNEDEIYKETIKNFSTITDLEHLKHTFFNKEYEIFDILIKEHSLKYYRASYNYSSDKDGVPEYIAKNLLKGFVRNLEHLKKYFIAVFRCYIYENFNIKTYSYQSLWILNSNDNLEDIIGSLYEDFTFIENIDDNIDSFLLDFRHSNNTLINNLLDETYLH